MAVDVTIQRLAALFMPTARLVIVPPDPADLDEACILVDVLRPGEPDPESLQAGNSALLVIPDDGADARQTFPTAAALVAVEAADTRMARIVAQLLNPGRLTIELAHVTRLSGIITSPTDGHGLENPRAADVLMYDGAKDALIDTADDLRAASFKVNTHLREDSDTARALEALTDELAPALIVLGRGKHASGPGARLLRERGLPVLYVPARG